MKNRSKKLGLTVAVAFLLISVQLKAQDCEIDKTNGGGFTTTIQSVVDNCDNTHTIVLRVEHDGCDGPVCKELSHYSVEADNGTYSNMSVAVISGGMTYTNLAPGPNLGSDPFDGFKIDGTENIGDGMAGVFTVTYTLTGGLQSQQTSAKAGTNGQIVNFTVEDFEYVMNCAGTTCGGGNNDSDGDGCDDEVDEYPNDPDRCYNNFFPATDYGTLAFEDLWPGQGDYDFNDLVIDYRFMTVVNSSNQVVDLQATFIIQAFGATLHNGFGFQFGNNTFDQSGITANGSELGESYISLGANGLENNQVIPTVIVYDDVYNQMTHPGVGIGVNTEPGAPYVTPDTITVNVSFPLGTYTTAQLNIPNFNPFLIRGQERGIEIHLPDYPPTSLVDAAYFGTAHDSSDPATGRYYKTDNNLPWAINIYETFEYPIERKNVTSAYLKFAEWANSSGQLFPDWYQDKAGYRDAGNIYTAPAK